MTLEVVEFLEEDNFQESCHTGASVQSDAVEVNLDLPRVKAEMSALEAVVAAKEQQIRDRDEHVARLEWQVQILKRGSTHEQEAQTPVPLPLDNPQESRILSLEKQVESLLEQLRQSQHEKAEAQKLLEGAEKVAREGEESKDGSQSADLSRLRAAVQALGDEKERVEVEKRQLAERVQQLEEQNRKLSLRLSETAADSNRSLLAKQEERLTPALQALQEENATLRERVRDLSCGDQPCPTADPSIGGPADPTLLRLATRSLSLSEEAGAAHTSTPLTLAPRAMCKLARQAGTPQTSAARAKRLSVAAREHTTGVKAEPAETQLAALLHEKAVLEQKLKRVTTAATAAADASKLCSGVQAELELARRQMEEQKVTIHSLEKRVEHMSNQLNDAQSQKEQHQLSSKNEEVLRRQVDELSQQLQDLRQAYDELARRGKHAELESAAKQSTAGGGEQQGEGDATRQGEVEAEWERKSALMKMRFVCAAKTHMSRSMRKQLGVMEAKNMYLLTELCRYEGLEEE